MTTPTEDATLNRGEKVKALPDVSQAIAGLDPIAIHKLINDPAKAEQLVRDRLSRVVQKMQQTAERIQKGETVEGAREQDIIWENSGRVDTQIIDALAAQAEQLYQKPKLNENLDVMYRLLGGEIHEIVQHAPLPFAELTSPSGDKWVPTIAIHKSFETVAMMGGREVGPGVPVRSLSFRRVPAVVAK